jgi:hypothetical protein
MPNLLTGLLITALITVTNCAEVEGSNGLLVTLVVPATPSANRGKSDITTSGKQSMKLWHFWHFKALQSALKCQKCQRFMNFFTDAGDWTASSIGAYNALYGLVTNYMLLSAPKVLNVIMRYN